MGRSSEAGLEQAERIQKVLWGGFTFSIVVYVAVAFMVVSRLDAPVDASVVSTARLVLIVLAAAVAVGATWFRRRALSDDALRNRLRRAGGGGDGGGDREAVVLAVLPHAQVTLLVSLAVHEAVAVCGLVLAFLSHQPADALPFAAVALCLDVMIFPNPRALVERARGLLGSER